MRSTGAGSPVRVSNKALIDFIFLRALEVATSRDVPLQIHTGYVPKRCLILLIQITGERFSGCTDLVRSSKRTDVFGSLALFQIR